MLLRSLFFPRQALALLILGSALPLAAQMRSGEQMKAYDEVFGVHTNQRTYPFNAVLVASSVPGNILYPGEQPSLTLQITNNETTSLVTSGKVRVIAYGTRGIPGDIWLPELFRTVDAPIETIPIEVKTGPKGQGGSVEVTITPKIPERFGAYALVVDLDGKGSRFATSLVRTFTATNSRIQYPKMSLDHMSSDVLQRLGVQAIRFGVGYVPSDSPKYPEWKAKLRATLEDLRAHNISALVMLAEGGGAQPLNRARPHLDDQGVMLKTKSDYVWLPSLDADFEKVVAEICSEYGWPKGPVTAVSLWNEPWEGMSISGWGADMLRFREIYSSMARGVLKARETAKVEVLLAGADSSSNAMDKLFPDGTDAFLPLFDVCTVHYQGLYSPALFKLWRNRTGPNGRVRVWDTESWVANTDDRVATVISGFRAAGYDRAMGIYGDNIATPVKANRRLADGKNKAVETVTAWPVAAAIGAVQHFIGERDFREFLFQNGLPWIFVYDGLAANQKDDGTVVVCGDLGEAFEPGTLPFRTARPAAGFTGGKLVLPMNPAFRLYDFYGNVVTVAGTDKTVDIPLDHRGFYLRTDGSAGSFDRLLAALRTARVEGYPPLVPVIHDPIAPVNQNSELRVSLTNILNRPVAGVFNLTVEGLTLDFPATLSFAPHETKEVPVRIVSGTPKADNTYPLSLNFDAGADGRTSLAEKIHVNLAAHRTVVVDGNLDDWKGVLPQTVSAAGDTGPTLTELAWLPFEKFTKNTKSGLATGWLAYDEKYFYFAAKIADDTPHPGTYRFEKLPEDDFFYPEVSYELDPEKTFSTKIEVWDEQRRQNAALVLPDSKKDERSFTRWESEASAIAVDLDLPADHSTQVAFYFVDTDSYQNGRAEIVMQMTDPTGGRILAESKVKEFGFGTYAIFELRGKVRAIFRSQKSWLPASLSGVFLDTVATTGSATPTATTGSGARFVSLDEKTGAHWAGHYGKEGFHVIGTEPRYPAWAKVVSVEEIKKKEYRWPEGVRRYTYRKKPVLPSGTAPKFDNVQIAFGVRAPGEGNFEIALPGVMPGFIPPGGVTDYEYALNKVSQAYGGGTEIWRLAAPGMPPKNFYPRQPHSPKDGPVKDGQLVMTHEGNTRIVECAIPWSEIPLVKQAVDADRPVRFSFRINDDKGAGMELAVGRSVSSKNNQSFHADWVEHWDNSLVFGFEKTKK